MPCEFTAIECSALPFLKLPSMKCKSMNERVIPLCLVKRRYGSLSSSTQSSSSGISQSFSTLQNQLQISYMISRLRHDKTVANSILTALETAQIRSGFTNPIFEDTSLPIVYEIDSDLISLRERIRAMGGSLWIEEEWTPSLQRVNDVSIMEAFIRSGMFTKHELITANRVRIWMRIVSIADITDPSGRFIPDDVLNGEFRAGSDLRWPNSATPTRRQFSTFRRMIHQTFCPKVPKYQRASYSLELDKPLGLWLPVPRNTWWDVCLSDTSLYCRTDNIRVIQVYEKDSLGFYTPTNTVSSMPLESHPICCTKLGDRYWTRKTLLLAPLPVEESKQPGYVVHDTLTELNISHHTHFKTGGDGSVHLRQQVAAASWLIAQDEEHILKATYLLEGINAVSSTRAEKESIYRLLRYVNDNSLKPSRITNWVDNEQAVLSSNNPLTNPSQLIRPDADLDMAIAHEKSKMDCEVQHIHIYGHQDSKKGKDKKKRNKNRSSKRVDNDNDSDGSTESPSEDEIDSEHCTDPYIISPWGLRNDDPKSSTAEEHEQTSEEAELEQTSVDINIACDELAGETTAAILEGGSAPDDSIIQPPYAGSKCMLRLGGIWITTNLKSEIYKACRTQPMIEFCHGKYKWSSDTFHSIHWQSINSVISQMTKSKQRQTLKIMHEWLPLGTMRHHITGVNQCPGCPCTDETLFHLLTCSNGRMKGVRQLAIKAMKQKAIGVRVPRHIRDAFFSIIEATLAGTTPTPKPTQTQQVQDAIMQQTSIGFDMMLRGFLASKWMTALEDSGVQAPERKMNALQRIIWEDLVNPM